MADFVQQGGLAPLPKFSDYISPQDIAASQVNANAPGWFMGGLKSGWYGGLGSAESAGAAAAKAVGADQTAGLFNSWADANVQKAAQVGRPDLENLGDQSLGSLPAFIGYKTAQSIPTLASMALGGLAVAALPEEAAIAAPVAGLAAGLRALGVGSKAATAAEGIAASRSLAAGLIGGTAATYPQAAGELYQQARQGGNDTQGGAAAALAGGLPYAATNNLEFGALKNILGKAGSGLVRHALTGGAEAAAATAVQGGIQTGIANSFRDDLSPNEKFQNIVEAVASGGVVGGALGGVLGGLRGLKNKNPNNITTDTLAAVTRDGTEIGPRQDTQIVPGADERTQYGPGQPQGPQLDATQSAIQRAMAAARMGREAPPEPAPPVVDNGVTGGPPSPFRALPPDQARALAEQMGIRMPDGSEIPSGLIGSPLDRAMQAAGLRPVDQPRVEFQPPAAEPAPPVQPIRTPDAALAELARVTGRSGTPRPEAPIEPGSPLDRAMQAAGLRPVNQPRVETARPKEEIGPVQGPNGALGQLMAAVGIKLPEGKSTEPPGPTAQDRVKQVRELATQIAPDAPKQLINKLNMQDPIDLAAKAKEIINSKAAASSQAFAEKVLDHFGINDTAEGLQAKYEAAVAKLGEAKTQAEKVAAAQEAIKADDGLRLLRQIEEKKNGQDAVSPAEGRKAADEGQTRQGQARPEGQGGGPAERGAGQAVELPARDAPRTALGEKLRQQLDARQKQQEIDAAGRQAEAQKAATRASDERAARAEAAVNEPTRIDPASVVGGGGSQDNVRLRTLGAFHALDKAAQDRVLEDFGNDPAKLAATIRKTPAGSQPALVDAIARRAGVPKETLRAAPAEKLSRAERQAEYDAKKPPPAKEEPVKAVEKVAEREVAAPEPVRAETAAAVREEKTIPQKAAEIVAKRAEKTPAHPAEAEVAAFEKANPGVNTEPLRVLMRNGADKATVEQAVAGARAEQAKATAKANMTKRLTDAVGSLLETEQIDKKTHDKVMSHIEQGHVDRAKFELQKAGVRFRATGDAGTGRLSAADLKKGLSEFKSRFGDQILNRTTVHEDTSTLPTHILESASDRGMTPDQIRGVVSRGETHIVAGNLRNIADLHETLAHEILGHEGTVKLFGKDHASVMEAIFDRAGGLEGLGKIAEKFGVKDQFADFLTNGAQSISHLTDELVALAAGKGTGKLKTAALQMLGQLKQATVKVLRALGMDRFANRIDKFGASDMAVLLRDARRAATGDRGVADRETAFHRGPAANVREMADRFKLTADLAAKAEEKIGKLDLKTTLTKFGLYISSLDHIIEMTKKDFTSGGMEKYRGVHGRRTAAENKQSRIVVEGANRPYDRLTKPAQEKIALLEQRANALNIDPRKSWQEQTWLHKKDKNGQLSPEGARNKRVWNEAQSTYKGLSEAEKQIYNDRVSINEGQHLQRMAVELYNAAKDATYLGLKLSSVHPMDTFMETGAATDKPQAFRDHWDGELTHLKGLVEKAVKAAQAGEKSAKEKNQKVDAQQSSATRALSVQLKKIDRNLTAMKQAPNFHLARKGEYFNAFRMSEKPESRDAIAEAFKKNGITNITVDPNLSNRNVFIRSENRAQWGEITRIVEELREAGHLDPNHRTLADVRTQSERNSSNIEVFEKFAQDEKAKAKARIDDLKARGATEAEIKEQEDINRKFLHHINDFKNNLLDDSALNAVLTRREDVPGYSTDAAHAYAHRARVAARSIATVALAPDMTDALATIRKDIEIERTKAKPDTDKIARMRLVANEIQTRDDNRLGSDHNSVISALRAANHAFFLGLSPAYMAVQLTQVPILAIPELGKKHGMVKAATAIGKATPEAFKILKAVYGEAKEGGLRQLPDIHITNETLTKAGLNPDKARFIMRLINEGLIDMGSSNRELGRDSEGKTDSKFDLALRYSSMMGLYAETMSRLVTGLAAYDLHGNKDGRHEYAASSIRQSMFTFNSYNTARALGSDGFFGKYTPLAFSFYSYQAQALEKLIREFHGAFIKGDKESQRWLAGHTAALSVFAGTLGLPFASVVARAIDGVSDLFGDEKGGPHDIQASYRNWLSDTFGQDMGEVMARGVPRAFGADVSGRVGEQDILPFSKFIGDRRTFRDSVKDWVFSMAGSPVNAAANIGTGMGQLADGDIMGGLKAMLPVALRNQVAAADMANRGYVDTRGNKLPMTANARSILIQSFGFTPSEKAEYQEQKTNQTNRQNVLTQRGAVLRNKFADALEGGDRATAGSILQQIRAYDQANPEMAIGPRLAHTIQLRQRARSISENQNVPLGTRIRDIAGAADRGRFANY